MGNSDLFPLATSQVTACSGFLIIIMKTTACDGMDVAKISDTQGKGMCKNPEYVDYLQRCIEWRMLNE